MCRFFFGFFYGLSRLTNNFFGPTFLRRPPLFILFYWYPIFLHTYIVHTDDPYHIGSGTCGGSPRRQSTVRSGCRGSIVRRIFSVVLKKDC